jgi:hypothetical protein
VGSSKVPRSRTVRLCRRFVANRAKRLTAVTSRLFEDSEVPQQPPEQEEDQDGAEASAAQLLGAISRSHPAQQLAHEISAPFMELVVDS